MPMKKNMLCLIIAFILSSTSAVTFAIAAQGAEGDNKNIPAMQICPAGTKTQATNAGWQLEACSQKFPNILPLPESMTPKEINGAYFCTYSVPGCGVKGTMRWLGN